MYCSVDKRITDVTPYSDVFVYLPTAYRCKLAPTAESFSPPNIQKAKCAL